MTAIEVIDTFACKDDTRYNLIRPWLQDGAVLATDGRILISVPEGLVQGHSYEVNENPPETAQVLTAPEYSPFDPELILAALEKVTPKEVDEFESCIVCDGEGGSICPECETDLECTACRGTGESNIPSGTKTPVPTPAPLLGSNFNWFYLDTVRKAMKVFGGTWEWGKQDATTDMCVHVFRNDKGVVIAAMPMRV